MSQKLSSPPPTVLPAGASEPAARFPAQRRPLGQPPPELFPAILDAAVMVAGYGSYGLVWLNEELKATSSYGQLVEFITLGAPITDSVLALHGLEAEILNLRSTPARILELPAIGLAQPDGETKRLNFSIFWQQSQAAFLILIYRVASQTELELELSRQIRARLMAEAAVTATSKELLRANTDLESFAAIISHDLKGPMRHMRRLTQQLAEEAKVAGHHPLSARLTEIETQSQRMSQMLSALLDYSSLGRKYEALVPVDTAQLIKSVVASLPKSGIAISINGSWPEIWTLAAPLDLVLRNLIENAIKHHDREHGEIEVSCAQSANALTISVADDGPGISQKHHEAAFLPFRTLSSEHSADSAGMGLAMVKKVVETAGGAIVLSSNPAEQRGTTFFVTWPTHMAV